MTLADKLGFGPKREIFHDGEFDTFIIKITPPKAVFPNAKTKEVRLTREQFEGYKAWNSGMLIQEALPDLTHEQREYILSGLDLSEDL